MDNCACAWKALHNMYTGQPIYFEQTSWCRLHMEAEIAKQELAAGADGKTANPNVDGAQTASRAAKKAGTT